MDENKELVLNDELLEDEENEIDEQEGKYVTFKSGNEYFGLKIPVPDLKLSVLFTYTKSNVFK